MHFPGTRYSFCLMPSTTFRTSITRFKSSISRDPWSPQSSRRIFHSLVPGISVSDPTFKHQIYISRSTDPFLNLSIEHYLLQETPKESTVLFVYINRPCVVIGRNQNPWLEANLRLLANSCSKIKWKTGWPTITAQPASIDLVRRRSGGGTVFHDHGNVNYSVICPTSEFSRDKHAEMVVRAIRHHNPRARVNKRHDIVLDQGEMLPEKERPDAQNTHDTAFRHSGSASPSLKISGSAYKLIRGRSLHHGTCLIESPNIGGISKYLNSPARAFITAKGVESVRSPVGNAYPESIAYPTTQFKQSLLAEFVALYGLAIPPEPFQPAATEPTYRCGSSWIQASLNHTANAIPEIRAGMTELQSREWIYGQTPQFTVSSSPASQDDDTSHDEVAKNADSTLPPLPPTVQVFLTIKSGIITQSAISLAPSPSASPKNIGINTLLSGRSVHEIPNFIPLLKNIPNTVSTLAVAKWLNALFGKIHCPPRLAARSNKQNLP